MDSLDFSPEDLQESKAESGTDRSATSAKNKSSRVKATRSKTARTPTASAAKRPRQPPSDPFQTLAKFVDQAQRRKDKVYVGIDPGATGAIAFVCGSVYAVIDIPVIVLAVTRTKKTTEKERALTGYKTKSVKGSTTTFDYSGICALFRLLKEVEDRMVVALEAVPSSLGPGRRHAEIMLNRAYAMWPLFLHSQGYVREEIQPSVWKEQLGLTSDKERSRRKAMALFPKADILRKQDHDRAEALLLAEYVRRMRRNA